MDCLADSWILKTLPFHRVQRMSIKNHWPFHGHKISPSFKSTPDYPLQLAGNHQSHQRQSAEVIFYSRYFFFAWSSVCSSFPNIDYISVVLFFVFFCCLSFQLLWGVLTPLVLGGSYLEWAEASDASATIVPPLLTQLKIMTSKFTSFGALRKSVLP